MNACVRVLMMSVVWACALVLRAAAGKDATAVTSVRAPTVVLYTAEGCGYCALALGWLRKEGVGFEQRDIGDATVAAELRARGGHGVPHAFFGDTAVVGYQPQRYAEALASMAGPESGAEVR